MSVSSTILLVSFAYCLGLPTTESLTTFGIRYVHEYPKVIQDHLELGNLLIQWNKEGKIYLLNGNNTASFSAAERICEKYNMELVKIENQKQNDTIGYLLNKYTDDGDGPFWMSGSRITDGEVWRWMDGTPMSYFNWARREPNNAKGDEMCIELYRDFAAWNDERCSIARGFVCENIYQPQTGFQPILDSNDILDNEDEDVNNQRVWQTVPAQPISENLDMVTPPVPHFNVESTLLPEEIPESDLATDNYDSEYDYYYYPDSEEKGFSEDSWITKDTDKVEERRPVEDSWSNKESNNDKYSSYTRPRVEKNYGYFPKEW